jgi:hypothetical protein
MSKVWSQEAAIARIRPRLWNYLRSHGLEYQAGLFIERVFDLPPRSFEELVAAHLSLSEDASSALQAIDEVLPRLPATVARREEEMLGVVHGPVDWTRTIQRRTATADPTLFVCRPTERRYDTPAARLCAAGVAAIVRVTSSSDLRSEGNLGEIIALRGEHARRLRKHPKLTGTQGGARLRGEAVARACRRWPVLVAVARFIELVTRSLDDRDPGAVEEVVSKRVLAPARADDLFELEVAFEILDGLEARGFVETTPPHVISDRSGTLPLIRMSSPDHGELSIWWERSFWRVFAGPPFNGLLREVLTAAGMTQSPYRPDLILDFEQQQRMFVVEVKATSVDGVAAERRGILEAFAYLLDAEAVFTDQPEPHALVVAWNATGEPAHSRVMVCDQASVGHALDVVLASV